MMNWLRTLLGLDVNDCSVWSILEGIPDAVVTLAPGGRHRANVPVSHIFARLDRERNQTWQRVSKQRLRLSGQVRLA